MGSNGWFLSSFVFSLAVITVIGEIENSKLYIEIAENRGYAIETHEVETEDGYLLTVFRIPYGKYSCGNHTNRYPVLLLHGLGANAEYFFWLDKSIGYLLADNDYDVWVMNARGSWHSIKHKTLDPQKDDAYWRFTFHEISVYDIPASIDYILNNTGSENVTLVAHSQGTTNGFVMGAFRPEYNEKVNGMVAMGPIGVLLKPTYFGLTILTKFNPVISEVFDLLGVQKFPPILGNSQVHALFRFFCGNKLSPKHLCKLLITSLSGPGDVQFGEEILPTVTSLSPSSVSVYQIKHFGQNSYREKFTTFDWGSPEENMRHYGSETPVDYNMSNINFPIALYHAQNDMFVTNETLEFLVNSLPNVSEFYVVPFKSWTHVDFLWATDMDIYVHQQLLETLEGFNNR